MQMAPKNRRSLQKSGLPDGLRASGLFQGVPLSVLVSMQSFASVAAALTEIYVTFTCYTTAYELLNRYTQLYACVAHCK